MYAPVTKYALENIDPSTFGTKNIFGYWVSHQNSLMYVQDIKLIVVFSKKKLVYYLDFEIRIYFSDKNITELKTTT